MYPRLCCCALLFSAFLPLLLAEPVPNYYQDNLIDHHGGAPNYGNRRRSLALPKFAGWVFSVTLKVGIPLEHIGTAMIVEVPFAYDVDTRE